MRNNILESSIKEKNGIDFNGKMVDFNDDKTINELFNEIVKKYPDKSAVIFKEQKLSYQELNKKANIIANKLRKKNITRDNIVGILIDPSLEMLIGIMGILKAGAAYLPIDTEYPKDRIEYMIEDSKATILLTKKTLINGFNFNGDIIDLEDENLYVGNSSEPKLINSPTDLAYVIYTSGSTGKPKGVLIEHRSLINLCEWHNRFYEVTSNDNSTKYAGFSFDASVWEIFPYLIAGASIHIIDKSIKLDVSALNNYFEKNKISIAFLPTQMCEQFMTTENKSLRKLVTGGDKLNVFKKKSYDVINNYGPTENTIVTSYFTVDKEYKNIPIGRPVDNTIIYILDENNNIVNIGEEGELCVAGVGLARGYLNRPDLTDQKFVENPFAKGEKMYRTGDLAKWNENGDVEFLGRIDTQVKIRGFRIELGEIESCLLKHDAVGQVVVADKEDAHGYKYLCAYIVPSKEMPSASDLKEHLSKEVPYFMVPSLFVEIESIPLTPNGKIDRRALPTPSYDMNNEVRENFETPENETEEKLLSIWKDLLEFSLISVEDDFFQLGGHSLKATMMTSRIESEFNVQIALSEIFKSPTIRDISNLIKKSKKTEISKIEVVEERTHYPLTSAQKRLFMIEMMDGGNLIYNNPILIPMEGNLDKDKIKDAIKAIVKKQDSLRTSFDIVDGEPAQIIHEDIEFDIDYIDLINNSSKENVDETISKLIKKFDFKSAPLFRSAIIALSENSHILFLDIHHIIFDGSSLGILIKDLAESYKGNDLDDLTIRYRDYAVWEKDFLQSSKIQEQEKFWLDMFEGELPVLNMPTDYPRPSKMSFKGDRVYFEVNRDLTQKLSLLSSTRSSTLYMILMASYNILLSKYSTQDDIIVGFPIAGRTQKDLESVVGMFVNSLAIRNKVDGTKTFAEFLESVRTNVIGSYENQDYPLEGLIQKLNIERDMSRNPLFDTMLVLQNLDIQEVETNDLKIKQYELLYQGAKMDMVMEATEIGDKISFILEYNTDLFMKETVERIAKHFTNILESVANNSDIKISEIDILSEEERNLILNDFNNTTTEYPREKAIHEIFEEEVAKNPEKIALVHNDKKMTYGELNEKANAVANILRNKGVKVDELVGIMVQRSFEMMVGILGILKSGAGYMPLDPKYPEDRIEYMVQDSKINILLTQSHLASDVNFDGEIILLDEASLYEGKTSNPEIINTPNDIAYVIYTSGSTGKPKGVMVEHRNVVRLIKNTNYVKFEEDERILQTGAIVFDASTFEFWGSLLNGYALYLVDEGVILEAEKLKKAIEDQKITTLWLTAPLFNQLTEQNPKIFDGVRNLLVGGDALSPKHINRIRDIYKDLNIINGYGPTENTTFSVCNIIDKEYKHNIPIGIPISNSTAYVVDKFDNLMPVGIPGELVVGGEGVARGYLNAKEMTDKKFIKMDFAPEQTIYRTGDMARWLPNGTIEFLGRIDNQVKIRGYRIEIGEIENHLLKYDMIKEGAVLVKVDNTGAKYLCAYFTSERELTISEIRKYLSIKLPDYMIPTVFMQVETMPLTANGKIDRKMLPEPSGKINTGIEYVAPQNAIEEKIAKVWESILGIDKIGVNDNFFHIGGSSIKAIQVVSRLMEDFEINVNHLFKYQTINELAKNVTIVKNNLKEKLEDLKARLEVAATTEVETHPSIEKAVNEYEERISTYSNKNFDIKNNYENVLIAGATGYLGANLVYQMLKDTNSNLYLLLRGKSEEDSKARISEKLKFYFEEAEIKKYEDRIIVVNGDLTKDKFSLSEEKYAELVENINAIINTAANVKHYGQYEEFYEINVRGVERLIDLALEGKNKDMHHVSTMSVADGLIEGVDSIVFTENDIDMGQKTENYYVKTKFEAEKLILEARERGLKCNIYRAGNLTFNSENGKFQENIQDNAFYKLIKGFIKTKAMPNTEILSFDFSFIDEVCRSINLLINAKELNNEIYHIYNPKTLTSGELGEVLSCNGVEMKNLPFNEYLDFVYESNENEELKAYIDDILLHTHILENIDNTEFIIKSDKTEFILEKLGFVWEEPSKEQIGKMLEYARKVNFI